MPARGRFLLLMVFPQTNEKVAKNVRFLFKKMGHPYQSDHNVIIHLLTVVVIPGNTK